MAAIITTPVITDTAVSVVALSTVAALGLTRGTIDLRPKYGAWLFLRVVHPGAVISRVTTVAPGTTITAIAINANSNIGDTTLATASAWTGIVHGDIIYIGGNSGSPARDEFARVSKIASTTLTVDSPMKVAHTSGDTVANKADAFSPVWLAGGSVYEVIFDYGGNATGSSIRVEALAATYDSDSSI